MMRSFRWIEINCFNILRFIAEVSTNFQKMHNFGRFFKKRKLDKWCHLFHLLFELCLWYSFLYLIIAKIHFHGILHSSILICKIPEFYRCKLWDENFASFDSENIHIKKCKKLGFTFSFVLRNQICSLSLNAILHWVEVKDLKFHAHFCHNAVFIGCNIYSLLSVICLTWNLHLKLFLEFLTFISFKIWR